MFTGVFDEVKLNRWIRRFLLTLAGGVLSFAGCVAFGLVSALLYWLSGYPKLPWTGSDFTDYRGASVAAGMISLLLQLLFYWTSRWFRHSADCFRLWDATVLTNPLSCGIGLILGNESLPDTIPFEVHSGVVFLVAFGFPGWWNQARLASKFTSVRVSILQAIGFSLAIAGAGIWMAIR
jgi:hypothetical protein